MASRQLEWGKNQEQLPWRGDITEEELKKHNKRDDCWVVFQGIVYDVTTYLDMHPGGTICIMDNAGGDCTADWLERHKWISPSLIEKVKIGKYVGRPLPRHGDEDEDE